ncbi:STAS domain-containing protein [Streptomyces sp. NBC_01218]|uniref:STAS domain-containing protein n=1 Tax=unclassified Streptomyces TaxID=2593676 RepID=UPI0023B8E1F7|nr:MULTISPECIES: STAS domain-containing protein [unclassified Streptomyces]WEH38461.1 STAS domain-containing protein [Streptomyces sp. AM 2-1-1]WSQ50119.1 STAS domain-containing protein [Streptomyces sp. NBC_01218]
MTGRKRPTTGTAFRVQKEGFALVRVRGEADEKNGAPELTEALGAALDEGTERTVVDLSETDFADSAVLHTLLDARARYEDAGVKLVLAGPFRAAVRRLFEVTGTVDAFVMAATVEEAAAC